MSINTSVDMDNSEIRVRIELTETKLLTKFYVMSSNDMPSNWDSISEDEKAIVVMLRGRHIRENIEEIQERTDGVYLTWDKSHPQWTVTFTYTNSEVVSAPTREIAIATARRAIARTYGIDNSKGAEQVLGNSDVEVVNGNWGL